MNTLCKAGGKDIGRCFDLSLKALMLTTVNGLDNILCICLIIQCIRSIELVYSVGCVCVVTLISC